MEKKSVTLVTGTEQTRLALLKQLEEYLGEDFVINSYAVDEGIYKIVKGHLIIISSEIVRQELLEMKLLDTSCDVVIAKRTINYDYIDQIVLIPKGTDVIFANDVPQTTYESIEVLKELGIDDINLIPYYPGIEKIEKEAHIAITPGEFDKVPPFITKIYDIGPRIMDFTTITEILYKLNILDHNAGNLSKKHLAKIIKMGKRLSKSTHEISSLNQHLNLVIDGLKDALLVYDWQGNVSVINENLKRLLNISHKEVKTKKVKDVIYNKGLLKFLLDKKTEEEKVFNLDDTEILVKKFYLPENQHIVVTFKSVKETMEANEKLRRELVNKGHFAKYTFGDIIGNSEKIGKSKDIAKKLAKTELTILIEGESGTGKEIFASAIHNESKRRKGPFLAVNFSALPDELIESELFGYEEGAFTGAKKGGKTGIFELADGGTIFLDEIGDISIKMQAKLLRVLQEKEVMRVGGHSIKSIDVRVIAATNKDLRRMVEEEKFREDLYYRLKMGYVNIPPLRERKKDISILIEYLMKTETQEEITMSDQAMNALLEYNWLGNVRELKNTLNYMLAVRTGHSLGIEDVPDQSFFKSTLERKTTDTTTKAYEETQPISQEEKIILVEIYKLYQEGKSVGRESLVQNLQHTEYPMTQAQVRTRLAYLERKGLIIKRRGRQGTLLTERGKELAMK